MDYDSLIDDLRRAARCCDCQDCQVRCMLLDSAVAIEALRVEAKYWRSTYPHPNYNNADYPCPNCNNYD